MKKYFVVLAALCMMGTSVAQAQMGKGSNLFNVGLGLGSGEDHVDGGFGLNASFDHGLVDTWGPGLFTIGGFAGFHTYGKSEKILDVGIDWRYNIIALAFRATYRYSLNESFEVYGALMTGLKIRYAKVDKNSASETDIFWGGPIAGCRYSFSPNMAVFAELGYSLQYFNGGLSFAF